MTIAIKWIGVRHGSVRRVTKIRIVVITGKIVTAGNFGRREKCIRGRSVVGRHAVARGAGATEVRVDVIKASIDVSNPDVFAMDPERRFRPKGATTQKINIGKSGREKFGMHRMHCLYAGQTGDLGNLVRANDHGDAVVSALRAENDLTADIWTGQGREKLALCLIDLLHDGFDLARGRGADLHSLFLGQNRLGSLRAGMRERVIAGGIGLRLRHF